MYNKVVMIGNLTRDIELRYLPSGSAVAKSAIATSYKYKTQTGEQKDEVCFLDFNIFGRSAEIANQYLKKGSKVLLEGRLVLEQWTGTDGQNRTKHSLRVDTMKMLDSKSSTEGGYAPQGNYDNNPSSSYSKPAPTAQSGQASGGMQRVEQQHYIPEYDINDDEIPF
ncbi:single-stranded DNA-binding protein [Arcobacter sp. FWKO B]|uniref:single-stranded DNA-binding protein n=1 Tax=Arcobacter sp. FWKO B TaxID=2593672 RepID=UPI0018A5833B|nr:single-stranded DNA-binding protein [Arcobacter sp. FWKO B]QOG13077.1 single-stranded DNA-binding protein [Arcobacter sp. FWKO B]